MIKLEMLRVFCAVAEAGRLADAAQQLGRTPSAVSMGLMQFQELLGRPLFESDRKSRLTPFGRQVLRLAKDQLRSFDVTVQSIQHLATAPSGVLKVAAVPSVAAGVFPWLVQRMEAAFPGLNLELRDSDTPRVIDALTSGWADIGIASAQQPINGVEATELFSDPYGLVMAEDHPLAQGQGPVSLDEVFQSGFIRNQLCDQITLRAFQDRLGPISLTVSNLQSLLSMLVSGPWVSVLPPSVLPLAGGRLVFRDIEGLTDQRRVMLLRRKEVAFPDIVETACREITNIWAKP
jgi:DNA-binding transcriptional LysR family regulator